MLSKPYLLPNTVFWHFFIKAKIIFSWCLYDGVWRFDFTIRKVLIHLFIIRLGPLKGLIILHNKMTKIAYILTNTPTRGNDWRKIVVLWRYYAIFRQLFGDFLSINLSIFFSEWRDKCKKEIFVPCLFDKWNFDITPVFLFVFSCLFTPLIHYMHFWG